MDEATERSLDLQIRSLHSETPREIATRLIAQYQSRYVPIYVILPGLPRRIKDTACNIFFTDVVQQMQLDGPYHWVDKKGNPMRYRLGIRGFANELSANGLIDWFEKYGYAHGWQSVPKEVALKIATTNKLVAVTYYNPIPNRSGHIAVLLEDGTIAQAGIGAPFVGKPMEVSFGNLPKQYWAYTAEPRNK